MPRRSWPWLLLLLSVASLAVQAAPPVIDHVPPSAEAGKELVLRAVIRAPGGVFGPELLWRTAGAAQWNRIPLRPQAEAWVAVLPAREVTPGTLEYYLQAYEKTTLDEGSWRSALEPQRLQVAPPPSPPVQSPPSAGERTPAPSVPTEPAPRRRGLFLRAEVTAGYLAIAGPVRANTDFNADVDLTSSGAGVGFALAAGAFLREDLVLGASVWNVYGVSPTLSPAPPAQDAKLSLIGLGPQVTYYFASDLSASAMAGLCASYLNAEQAQVHLNSLAGFGARLALGKEWPLGDRIAAGVAGQLTYAYSPGGETGRPDHLSTWMFGAALTVTLR